MTKSQINKWFYGLCLSFVGLNSLFIALDIHYMMLTPVIILLVLLMAFSMDTFLMLTALVVPLSIDMKESDLGAALSIPSEPLIIMLMVGFLFKGLIEQTFDGRVLKHPVTLVIFMYLGWIGITSVTSEIPSVSFKFLAVRLWFIVPFYFLATQVFRKENNIRTFLWMYVAMFCVVIIYTLINHAAWNFEKDPAHWVMTPFYYDHTQYGAMLAFFVPFLVGYALRNRRGAFFKITAVIVMLLFLVALYFSNSRAAWVSVVASLGIYMIFAFRIRWYVLLLGVSAVAFYLYAFSSEIMMQLEKNKQDSSENFTEHVQSMSNISSDASNLERLLRWNCAIRMFNERPVFGWGPGTYSFCYAPFQRSYELTIISTNFGDGGNAHSEYLGPLAEQGLPGMLLFILLILVVSYTAIRVIKNAEDKWVRALAMQLFLCLCTYWIHGFLNNFLDTDKAAVPYWGCIAALVALDIYQRKNQKKRQERKAISSL